MQHGVNGGNSALVLVIVLRNHCSVQHAVFRAWKQLPVSFSFPALHTSCDPCCPMGSTPWKEAWQRHPRITPKKVSLFVKLYRYGSSIRNSFIIGVSQQTAPVAPHSPISILPINGLLWIGVVQQSTVWWCPWPWGFCRVSSPSSVQGVFLRDVSCFDVFDLLISFFILKRALSTFAATIQTSVFVPLSEHVLKWAAVFDAQCLRRLSLLCITSL